MEHYLNDYGWAVFFGVIGWGARVAWTYFNYSNQIERRNRKFKWKPFIEKYDQYWVFGFFAMLMLSAISDMLWEHVFSVWLLDKETPYEATINVIIGFTSVYLLQRVADKTASSEK